MCGIAGYIGTEPVPGARIEATLELMKNRGPDFQDVRSFRFGDRYIHLLHSRLSIIDLDPRSNQPFSKNGFTIVFNGEIYNYVELSENLKRRGVNLRTSSDTEVLLHYYEIYGESCVEYFEGMWAFAIWNEKKGELFLSRDRFAEKPLYYFDDSSGFYFGSETRFLRSLSGNDFEVNQKHLLRHLLHGYKALYKTAETYYAGVHEIPYATSMVLTDKGQRRSERYWTPHTEVDETMSLGEAIEGTRSHLLDSVRIRLRSDVPLAFCLSGGVDSAALVSIAVKEFGCQCQTFSIIDEDERYNEEDNIRATIDDLGVAHHLIHIPKARGLERLRKQIRYHDAPVATISYYVHAMISEAVAGNGCRVSFSGTSADELFTGYYDHFVLHLNEMRHRDDYRETYLEPWSHHVGQFIRNEHLKNPDLYLDTPDFRDHVFDASDELRPYLRADFREPYTEETFTPRMLRNRMLNELFHEATPVILHEDDLNSMQYSIENRSPYLDSNLQKFAYSIPEQHLIRDGFGKYVLREAVAGILNDKVRLDRRKKGFNASINSVFDLENADVRNELLEPSPIYDLIDREKFSKLLNETDIPNHFSKFIFNVANAKLFLELN